MNIQDFEIFKGNAYTPFENGGNQYLLNREPYLDIVLSDFCNCDCSFCIADLLHDKLRLNFDIGKKKVKFAVGNMRVKEVLLLGGEPTTSIILIPFIEFLKTLGLNKIIMTTNGLNLARNKGFREKIFSSGLTHVNVSFMSLNLEEQTRVTESKQPLTLADIAEISTTARKHGVQLRINNNVYRGNNDKLLYLLNFYEAVRPYVDSVKFSPLLKTDAFSVVDFKTQWVKDHILSDEEYDELFEQVERLFVNRNHLSIITNNELFGFVKNSMVPLDVPLILNWNQHGQMMNKVVNEHKINNLKILPNGELSLSWNREMTQYFIKTD